MAEADILLYVRKIVTCVTADLELIHFCGIKISNTEMLKLQGDILQLSIIRSNRIMATASSSKPTPNFSTTGTVSSPLDLDAKGEHQMVELSNKKRKIRPKPKVTLTSLTINNVSLLALVAPSVGTHAFLPDRYSDELVT